MSTEREMNMSKITNRPVRIALLDDHDAVLYGFSSLLEKEADFLIVGKYRSSASLFAGLRAEPADILLLDFALGPDEIDGLNMIRALQTQFPRSQILIASAHYNPSTVSLVIRAGGRGFFGKTQELTDVVIAIRALVDGKIYVSPAMSQELLQMGSARAGNASDPAPAQDADDWLRLSGALTLREREVLRCFLSGMTVTEIAEKFNRSPKTISTQKGMVFKKLGIRNDSDFFKYREQLDRLV